MLWDPFESIMSIVEKGEENHFCEKEPFYPYRNHEEFSHYKHSFSDDEEESDKPSEEETKRGMLFENNFLILLKKEVEIGMKSFRDY